ncbi:MAG TPA: fructosamine kinase family protein [Polyangia bacterium]|jgi:fructosamine-3-kinase|nr:fructosamine kinase family protein [Polyangia bacterium]
MEAGIRAALEAAVAGRIAGERPVGGGDINRAEAVTLADGRRLFVKTNVREPAGMFAAEARGLAWLAEARVLRVPEVVAHGPGFLALELVVAAPPAPDFDERLGRGLAALHRRGAPDFGLDRDNFIGRLPQDNTAVGGGRAGWAEFYRARRLEPQLRRAADEGLASSRMRRGFERLFAELDALVGPPEPPARLHGDLWGGNLLCDEAGAPCLCDPAVYGGNREIDLAMMRLFGGFGARTFAAYEEAWPLAAGHAARVPLYQLYPLMVHVNLFGGGYVGQVEAILDRLT